MEEILNLLSTEPDKAIAKIAEQGKDIADIKKYQKEINQNDRTIRDTQVGNIQKDKTVGKGEKAKLVKTVKTPIKFAKKIVTTATVMEVGEPVTLIPSEENDLSKLIEVLWNSNRLDNKLHQLIYLKKSETQAAINFYIKDIDTGGSFFYKMLIKAGIKSQKKEIKSKILDNSKGIMTPYFDNKGDMLLFMWQYKSKSADGKEFNNVEIWDDKNFYQLNDSSGKMQYSITPTAHGFGKIPIVYVSQNEPEWFDVKEMIDRIEVSLSKLGGSNDYSAYPLLQIIGQVESMPDKDESGKVVQFPMVKDDDGKWQHGKAEFLTASNSVESAKLELDTLKNLIYSISHTPDLSFENVKGLGTVSGVALKLLFLDAIIKAKANEGDNKTTVERLLNVLISGVINTTNTTMAKFSDSLFYDIIFNSIIPQDLQASTDIIIKLKEAGLLSTQTAIKLIDYVDNIQEEMSQIEKDNSSKSKTDPPKTV